MEPNVIDTLVEYEMKGAREVMRAGVTQFLWKGERYGDRAELEAAVRTYVLAKQSGNNDPVQSSGQATATVEEKEATRASLASTVTILTSVLVFGVLGWFAWQFLSGGALGTLSRSGVESILNSDRGAVCMTFVQFKPGGLRRAYNDKIFTTVRQRPGNLMAEFIVTFVEPDDEWFVHAGGLDWDQAGIQRRKNTNRCLSGKAEVTAIVDGPVASHKTVEYVEVVSLPSELTHMEPYVELRYPKRIGLERTDAGWRVAR